VLLGGYKSHSRQKNDGGSNQCDDDEGGKEKSNYDYVLKCRISTYGTWG
jgi:hypothetical protein